MGCAIAYVVCLALLLLAHVDDVSGRPAGEEKIVMMSASIQEKHHGFGSVPPQPGSERVPNTGSAAQKQSGGLKEFVIKAVEHFRLHAPPAAVIAFPVTFIAITLLCCITCAVDRPAHF
ncbi:hypothetical protein C0J45_13807 [Silurus meridionalis]|uniref:Uncharacterized protein n=1 Tax=Silurus meridionalis TaxID=175797 RepID=A0A8T0AVU4_SILME|nr:hypothetical protein HF521_005822 [Silurus meridionalis]KAI5096913.1 hypothetical protein C0J45_13807 [Silurus meridionalis]